MDARGWKPYIRTDEMVLTRDKPAWYVGSPEIYKAAVILQLKNEGFESMSFLCGPKSRVLEWDVDVYIGIIQRLDHFFHWVDTHWAIPEPELLRRVQEWNQALNAYCDAMNLTGEAPRVLFVSTRPVPWLPAPICHAAWTKLASRSLIDARRANRSLIALASARRHTGRHTSLIVRSGASRCLPPVVDVI